MSDSVKLILAFVGLLLFLPESKKTPELSDLQRKRRNKKLFYISNGRVIPRARENDKGGLWQG